MSLPLNQWVLILGLAEHYGEPVSGGKPFSDISAIPLEVADGEVDQPGRGLVGREGAARLDRLPDHAVQAFHGIRRVDDLADRRIAGSPDRRVAGSSRRTGSPPARPGARPARSRRISRRSSP